MKTILDVDSSAMTAQNQVQKWAEGFLQRYLAPLTEAQLVLWWGSQPPQVHEALRQLSPQAHADVEKKVKEITERTKRNGTP